MKSKAVCLIAVIGLLVLPAAGQIESRDAREHLRHPQIAYDADSETYYLTRTANINTLDAEFADFQNNDGVRLWNSKELKGWEEIGRTSRKTVVSSAQNRGFPDGENGARPVQRARPLGLDATAVSV